MENSSRAESILPPQFTSEQNQEGPQLTDV